MRVSFLQYSDSMAFAIHSPSCSTAVDTIWISVDSRFNLSLKGFIMKLNHFWNSFLFTYLYFFILYHIGRLHFSCFLAILFVNGILDVSRLQLKHSTQLRPKLEPWITSNWHHYNYSFCQDY